MATLPPFLLSEIYGYNIKWPGLWIDLVFLSVISWALITGVSLYQEWVLIKTSCWMKIYLVLTARQNIAQYFCTYPHHQLCFATIVATLIVRSNYGLRSAEQWFLNLYSHYRCSRPLSRASGPIFSPRTSGEEYWESEIRSWAELVIETWP